MERELDEELAFHVERETQKHVAAGLSPAAARARALARFGSLPLAADQCRDARGTALVDDLARDILYALRTYRRAPLAALTIVATVGLGLGLISVVFTVYKPDAHPAEQKSNFERANTSPPGPEQDAQAASRGQSTGADRHLPAVSVSEGHLINCPRPWCPALP